LILHGHWTFHLTLTLYDHGIQALCLSLFELNTSSLCYFKETLADLARFYMFVRCLTYSFQALTKGLKTSCSRMG
jgi:hypothetical protein